MKLIATEYPPIEDGVYSATLLQIEQREPGLTGALTVLNAKGQLAAAHDTPTLCLGVSRGRRQEYDLPGMVQLLRPYAGGRTP
jgi:hypothetical protein